MTIQPIHQTPAMPDSRPATTPANGPAFARWLQQAETPPPTPSAAPAPTPPGMVVSRLAVRGLPALPAFMLQNPPEPAPPPTNPRAAELQASAQQAALLPPARPMARPPAPHFTVPLKFTPSWEVNDDPAPATQPPLPATGRPLALSEFPRPTADNGRGIHWIPSLRSEPAVVDRFVNEAQQMGIRWVTFLNDGANTGDNDYLVQQLRAAGIMPVMRVYTLDGAPLEGDVQAMVRHYKALGVPYFQLYNEPNLRLENQGREPDVDRYVELWTQAAQDVVAAGGLPGIGSLSPQGDVDDLQFFRDTLQAIKARGQAHLLDKAWISAHNYGRDHLRVREYNRIAQEELGRALPIIGTEAGFYADGSISEAEQVQVVTGAYDYLRQREPYYFAYTYWIIANEAGGHPDASWSHQALFRTDGHSPIVDWLRGNAT